jgi:MFS superfamily sulfate permease-like transporter
MAGEIVGRLFPGYFLYNLVLSLLALILFFISRRVISGIAPKGFRLPLFCLVIAVLVNIFVFFKLHPEIKAIKKEIHSFETVSSEDPLRMKFRRLHGISAVLNLLLFVDGVTLLVVGTVIKK